MKHSPGTPQANAPDQAAHMAHQHANLDGATQADSMHAAMANKAAMGAMGTMMGGTNGPCKGGSDWQNAARMMRSVNPGGMMGGSQASGGTSGSSTGGTTSSGSMLMGGGR